MSTRSTLPACLQVGEHVSLAILRGGKVLRLQVGRSIKSIRCRTAGIATQGRRCAVLRITARNMLHGAAMMAALWDGGGGMSSCCCSLGEGGGGWVDGWGGWGGGGGGEYVK